MDKKTIDLSGGKITKYINAVEAKMKNRRIEIRKNEDNNYLIRFKRLFKNDDIEKHGKIPPHPSIGFVDTKHWGCFIFSQSIALTEEGLGMLLFASDRAFYIESEENFGYPK